MSYSNSREGWMKHIKRETKLLSECRQPFILLFSFKKVPADFRNPLPFRRLLAEPSRRNAFGVSASQLFGRSVAHFFNSMRLTVKKHQ